MEWCFPLPSFFGLLLLLGGAVCCSSILSGAASSSFSGGAVSLIGLWVVLGLTSLKIQGCREVRAPNLWGRWFLGCCFFSYLNYVSCCLGLWALELSSSLTVAMVLPSGIYRFSSWCLLSFGVVLFSLSFWAVLLWLVLLWLVLLSHPSLVWYWFFLLGGAAFSSTLLLQVKK